MNVWACVECVVRDKLIHVWVGSVCLSGGLCGRHLLVYHALSDITQEILPEGNACSDKEAGRTCEEKWVSVNMSGRQA